MARRVSGRRGLERLRAEAAATEREREEKRKAKEAARATGDGATGEATGESGSSKPAADSETRMKVVWSVCNQRGEEVKAFPFPQKAEAEAECARLSKRKRAEHMIIRRRVPLE